MTRLEKFQQRSAPLADAVLISSAQNQFYLSEFSYDDGYLLIFADAAYLLADFRYIEAAKQSAAAGFTVLRPEKGMNDAVCDLLEKHGAKTLLVEEDHVTVGARGRLEAALSGVELRLGASKILTDLRLYKDTRELAAIAAAQELTDAAFSHVLKFLKRGVREIDVALELELFMRRNGADGIAFDTIAVSGTASAPPHGGARRRAARKRIGERFFNYGFRCPFWGILLRYDTYRGHRTCR